MTSYVVWTNSSVEETLDHLDREQRRSFERACDVLQSNPYPRGNLIRTNVRVQHQFVSYFDRKFPFIIRFVVSEYPVAGMGVIDIFALDDFTLPGDPVTMLVPE